MRATAPKRDKPEEIVLKLLQIEVLQGQDGSIADAVRQIGVTQQTYFPADPSAQRCRAGHSADMLGWFVEEQDIEPHTPVFDKFERKDATFPAIDFIYDPEADAYR
jgi:hypothetical protein